MRHESNTLSALSNPKTCFANATEVMKDLGILLQELVRHMFLNWKRFDFRVTRMLSISDERVHTVVQGSSPFHP